MEPNQQNNPVEQNPEPVAAPPPQVATPQPVSQPFISQQPQPAFAGQPLAVTPQVKQSNVLGIVGLILAVLLPLIGFVVSLIAYKKARKKGGSGTLSIVAIIISVLFFIAGLSIIYSTFTGVQGKALDVEKQVDVEFLRSGVEQYVLQEKKFPESLDNLKDISLPGVNADNLEAALISPDKEGYNYEVTPAGCDKRVTCTGFRIYTTLSTGEKFEIDNSLR